MFINSNGFRPAPLLDEFEGGGGAEIGAEESDFAEPIEADETEGVEEAEFADQPTGKTDADARFAEMRRENERLRAQNQDLEDALGNFFDGDTEQKLVSANALAQGKTEQEIRDEIEAENEWNRLTQENEELNSKLIDIETKTQMEHDLATIQKIDPNVKSLDDLGNDYFAYIEAGLEATQAYYAAKAKERAEKTTPPKEVGKVNQSTGSSDYYTREEVQSMSQEEVHQHYDAIRKSMSQW